MRGPTPPRPSRTVAGAEPPARAAPMATRLVEYLGAEPVALRGPVSARSYGFSDGQRVQPVARADFAGLLRMGPFRAVR
jgi:hypothetical protein